MKKWLPLIIIVALILIALKWGIGVNNMLVEKEGVAKAQWANVESSYQRRADLIPNLVATVRGYADHEKETLEAVIKARSEATKPEIKIGEGDITPEKLAQFQQAQQKMSTYLKSHIHRSTLETRHAPSLPSSAADCLRIDGKRPDISCGSCGRSGERTIVS